MIRWLAGCAMAVAAASAAAQELTGFAGTMRGGEPESNSFAWQISYTEDLGEHFAASFSYLNEGHIPNHHRDGHAVQLWAKTRLGSPQFTVAAGAGPYYHYDTTLADSADGFTDEHGLGMLYSLSATWRTGGRWQLELRYNRVVARHGIDTRELLFGVGYRLDKDDSATVAAASSDSLVAVRDEIAAYLGLTIVNSFESPTGLARSVEYRHAFGPVLKGSLAWLAEGEAELTRRNGVVAQGWLEPGFSGGRFTLGVGAGLYLAVDSYREDDHGAFGTGIVSMAASWRFAHDWTARCTWHRILSSYNRDSDILLLGIGYRL